MGAKATFFWYLKYFLWSLWLVLLCFSLSSSVSFAMNGPLRSIHTHTTAISVTRRVTLLVLRWMFWEYVPCEMKKIILRKMKFNPRKVRLNGASENLDFQSFYEFSNIAFNLKISSPVNCPTSHWSKILQSLKILISCEQFAFIHAFFLMVPVVGFTRLLYGLKPQQ